MKKHRLYTIDVRWQGLWPFPHRNSQLSTAGFGEWAPSILKGTLSLWRKVEPNKPNKILMGKQLWWRLRRESRYSGEIRGRLNKFNMKIIYFLTGRLDDSITLNKAFVPCRGIHFSGAGSDVSKSPFISSSFSDEISEMSRFLSLSCHFSLHSHQPCNFFFPKVNNVSFRQHEASAGLSKEIFL